MRKRLCLLVLSSILLVAQGRAQTVVDGVTTSFAFDEPDGKFDSLKKVVDCSTNAARATVQFSRYGKSTKWPPGVTIALLHDDDDGVVLHVYANELKPPFSANLMVVTAPDNVLQELDFAKSTGTNGTFSIELEWTATGVVTATIDGESKTVDFAKSIEYIKFNGSTGAGKYDPLWLGYIGSPNNRKDGCLLISQNILRSGRT